MKRSVYFALGCCCLAVVFSTFSISSQAQTPKRKPKPLATPPTRVLTGAEIISQGGTEEEPVDIVPVEKPTPRPPSTNTGKIRDLNDRVRKLESVQETGYDAKQKRLLMNLDIITRAETRAEALRKQLFDMIDKENTIKARLEKITYDVRPEVIERDLVTMGGSMRPEELRDNRRKMLEAERNNLESLLTTIQSNRASLEATVLRADQMVDKLRAKLEKDIDDSLVDEPAKEETTQDQTPREEQ
jgi:hypothetical protein